LITTFATSMSRRRLIIWSGNKESGAQLNLSLTWPSLRGRPARPRPWPSPIPHFHQVQ
jgi:hypothetical protein